MDPTLPSIEDVILENAENTDRIMRHAIGYLVTNNALGVPVISTFNDTATQGIAVHVATELVAMARSVVRDLDPTNELTFLRIGTTQFEYLVAPETEFTIVVLSHNRGVAGGMLKPAKKE